MLPDDLGEGLVIAAVLAAGLTQCSRSVVAQEALLPPGEPMRQVLEDHQAGYHEQVFNFSKGGQEHELFLVMGQDDHRIRTGYLDGERLSPEQMNTLMQVLGKTRNVRLVTTSGNGDEQKAGRMAQRIIQSDSIEKQIRLMDISGGDSSVLIKLRENLIGEEVNSAMSAYTLSVK